MADLAHEGPNDADVVVVGGGPAGAAAARLLALWGRRAVVVTRPPAAHALAESLPPSCERLLERTGVAPAVRAAGFVRATGNTVWWGGAPARAERYAAGALGYQVARDAFDRLLLAEAERAGAAVVRDAVVRRVERAADGRGAAAVEYARDGDRRVTAPWVLDCSGRAGLVARRGLRRADAAPRTLALAGIWERADGWPLADATHTLVESHAGGWSWSVPVSRTRRWVTAMVDPALTAVASRQRLGAAYRAALAGAPQLGALCAAASLVAGPFARDASPYGAARVHDGGVLLVGDAASFVDPLSSYGVKKALASAWLAAVVVHTALGDASLAAPALALFAARERAMHGTLRARAAALAREAARAHASPFWEARAAAHESTAASGDAGSERAEPGADAGLADAGVAEPDVAALRRDPDVRAAVEAIRGRPSLALRAGTGARRERRPVVRGNVVGLEDHLVAPAFGDGVRWLRGVDLVVLADLAPRCRQVPELYEAYGRVAPNVPLPDFLGALAVLVGKRVLDLGEGQRA